MYEIANFINRKGKLSTGIQQVNYPIHKGKPNPVHGKYYLVGSVPVECHEKYYDSEGEAIKAAMVNGAKIIQNTKCNFVNKG